jgi:hypothetical protein
MLCNICYHRLDHELWKVPSFKWLMDHKDCIRIMKNGMEWWYWRTSIIIVFSCTFAQKLQAHLLKDYICIYSMIDITNAIMPKFEPFLVNSLHQTIYSLLCVSSSFLQVRNRLLIKQCFDFLTAFVDFMTYKAPNMLYEIHIKGMEVQGNM